MKRTAFWLRVAVLFLVARLVGLCIANAGPNGAGDT
jgi:hypothetical protein